MGFEYLPPLDEIEAFFEYNSTRIMIGAYIFSLFAFFLIWFVGSLRSSRGRAGGDSGSYSAIAIGAGVAASGVLLVGAAIMMSAAQIAGTEAGYCARVGNSFTRPLQYGTRQRASHYICRSDWLCNCCLVPNKRVPSMTRPLSSCCAWSGPGINDTPEPALLVDA